MISKLRRRIDEEKEIMKKEKKEMLRMKKKLARKRDNISKMEDRAFSKLKGTLYMFIFLRIGDR